MGAVLSFFIPGLGHIYHGKVAIGIFALFITFCGYCLFIVPGMILHLICITDGAHLDKIKKI